MGTILLVARRMSDSWPVLEMFCWRRFEVVVVVVVILTSESLVANHWRSLSNGQHREIMRTLAAAAAAARRVICCCCGCC